VSETLATAPDVDAATKTIWLRMTKQGARYRMWYSTDGSTFTPVYETGAPLEDVNVGLFAVGGTTVRASYDYFRISGQSQPASIPALAGPPVTPPPTSGTPQGPRPDRTRPLLWLHSGRVQSRKALRTRGLRFRVSANERLRTLEATLWVRFASHGKRHVAVRLARQTLHGVKARQVVTLVLRPSAKLRRRLSTQGRLPGLLRIRATDVAGNRSTRTKPLVFH
jgi:hypothetical protein